MPSDTPRVHGAVGTDATCAIQAFFILVFSLAFSFYYASISGMFRSSDLLPFFSSATAYISCDHLADLSFRMCGREEQLSARKISMDGKVDTFWRVCPAAINRHCINLQKYA